MTIGPAPTTRIDSMSLRFGIAASSGRCMRRHQLHEAVEQVIGIVRPRARLRVGPGSRRPGRRCGAGPWIVPSNNERWVTARLPGRFDSSTANPWFWLEMRIRPDRGLLHRVGSPPWWPNFIFIVAAPLASASNWCPRQMPEHRHAPPEKLPGSTRWHSRRAPDRRGRWRGTPRAASGPAPPGPGFAPAPPRPGTPATRARAGCCA